MRRAVTALPLIVLAASALGQMFPARPTGGTVYDGAHLLSVADIAKINTLSKAFKRDTGAPIVVATFPSLDGVGAKGIGVERYSTALFDEWRIGSKAHNGGIMLVVAKAEHKARIELGKDWGHRYDAGTHRIMQGTILPTFKKGDYSDGIVRGCEALADLAKTGASNPASDPVQKFSPSAPSTVPSADSGPPPNFSDGPTAIDAGGGFFPFGGILCFAVPIVLFVVIAAAVSGRRRNGYGGRYGGSFGSGGNTYVNNTTVVNNDDGFGTGLIAGSLMSQPNVDPGSSFDSGPSFDSSPSFDSGSSASDSGSSSDSGGSSDSGSSGGGGDTGSW